MKRIVEETSVFKGQYLSKDKIVTTIERLQDECEEQSDNNGVELLEKLFNKLDTLEVKEITSLQEEPVSKVWHDANERPDYNVGKSVIVGYNNNDDLYDECDNVAYHITLSIFVSRKDLNTKVVRWAYLKDLI